MKYAALLRGINVGTTKRIDMKHLKSLFESLGYINVATYINSGNVRFESNDPVEKIRMSLDACFRTELGYEVPTLVKSLEEMQLIAAEIPAQWQNDSDQRTDVAYLFDDIDNIDIIDKLPFKKDIVYIHYVKGAVIWNLSRGNYNKSRLNKLIGHTLYQSMTLRNVNTARRLAED
jgi:uncharacterized protein (DUF1697 family)